MITPDPSIPSQEVENLPPFPHFCYTIGMIPTSYKNSLTYEEQLMWLCDFLENTVIPTVNNNGKAVTELQNLYIQLHTYVDNYFTNLDVQEEINNKLDAMAADGSLDNIFQPYLQQFQNQIQNQLDVQNNKINSIMSGSPRGVYNTLNDLTNANPPHSNIYVVKADGKWYYYNNTSNNWEPGGVYQSQVIAPNSVSAEAMDYVKLGSLFSQVLNNYITVNNTSEGITATIPQNMIVYTGNNFYTVTNQTISVSPSTDVIYLIAEIVNNKAECAFKSQRDLFNSSKGTYYILGYFYNQIYHALLNEKITNTINFLRHQSELEMIGESINYNPNTKVISFTACFILYNNSINSLTGKTVTLDTPVDLRFIVWNGTDLEVKKTTDKFDPNKIICVSYKNMVYNRFSINTIGFYKNDFKTANMILGNINIDTVNQQIVITNPFFVTPTRSYSMFSEKTTIEIPIPTTNETWSLCFDLQKQTFSLENMAQMRYNDNKWWLLSVYNNNVYPLINPKLISINGTPFYNLELDPENVSISLTMNQIFEKLANKSQPTKITIVGDSIAHGVGGTGFNQNGETIITYAGTTWKRNPDGYCWANLFKNYIEENYNATVLNNACTGTETNFLVNNISTLIPPDTDIVIICYGTNNRSTEAEDNYNSVFNTLTANFKSILNYCKSNNIKYCVNSPIPSSVADEERKVDGKKRWVHLFQISNIIKNIAGINKFEFGNMYNIIYNYCFNNNIEWNSYLSDGLHPNDAGYKILYYKYLQAWGLSPSYKNID